MKKSKSQDINKSFYDRLYRKRGPTAHFLRMWVSFDQQSKSKPNWLYLRRHVEAAIALENKEYKLLDYGSGWGAFLGKVPKKVRAYCFDLSETAMDMTCLTLQRMGHKIERAEVHEGNLVPEKYDFIVCSHVLEHVDNDSQLLELFSRSLEKDGKLLINVPINEVWDDPKHVREYDLQSLVEKMNEVGLDIGERMEVDKWTGYLLEQEFGSGHVGALKNLALRGIRLILAVMPLRLVYRLEKMLLSDKPNQQLIVVAEKR